MEILTSLMLWQMFKQILYKAHKWYRSDDEWNVIDSMKVLWLSSKREQQKLLLQIYLNKEKGLYDVVGSRVSETFFGFKL